MFELNWGTLLPRIIGIAIVLVIMSAVLFAIKKFTRLFLEKNASKEKSTMSRVIANILRTIVVVCAVLAILQACGVNVSGTIAGLGIASAIVGVAFQDYIKDIISGMRIINDKFFMLGDVIEYNGYIGVVEEFTIKITKIRVIMDGAVISISNRLIDNCRKLSEKHPSVINVPIPYSLDPAAADEILLNAVKEIEKFEEIKEAVYCSVVAYEASSVTYKIVVFSDPRDMYRASYKCHRYVFETLIKNGISIPYTTLTVSVEGNEVKTHPNN